METTIISCPVLVKSLFASLIYLFVLLTVHSVTLCRNPIMTTKCVLTSRPYKIVGVLFYFGSFKSKLQVLNVTRPTYSHSISVIDFNKRLEIIGMLRYYRQCTMHLNRWCRDNEHVYHLTVTALAQSNDLQTSQPNGWQTPLCSVNGLKFPLFRFPCSSSCRQSIGVFCVDCWWSHYFYTTGKSLSFPILNFVELVDRSKSRPWEY